MIKVQSLRLRGLVASSLLALAACSGSPSEVLDVKTNAVDGTPLTGAPAASTRNHQDPQGQAPQDPRDRGALVKKAVENAKRSLELRLFEDARNEAAYALELDNNNAEARDILVRCDQVLGGGSGVAGKLPLAPAIIEDRIRQERERALVENDVQLGQAHMEAKQFGRAIDHFERAAIVLRSSQYVRPNDPMRLQAEKMLQDAKDAKAKAEIDSVNSARARSQADVERLEREQSISRDTKVASLLEGANLKFQSGDYGETVRLVDMALLMDPTNPTALALRDLADRARHNSAMDQHRERWRTEWNKTFLELQQSTVPQTETVDFDTARWSEVSKRKPAGYSMQAEAESPTNNAIAKLLDTTVAEHTFASATVQDWASFYTRLTGAQFFVTQAVKDLPAETTTLNDFRLSRRSVADALRAIQTVTTVGFKVKDGMVYLVVEAEATGAMVLQPYNISELVTGLRDQAGPNLKLAVPGDDAPVFVPPDEEPKPALFDMAGLQDLIKTTIKPGKWDPSPFSLAGEEKGPLFVNADRETQEEVARLLNELRKHVGIQIDVEARFLKVDDSFLEDVGIDLRGLGNQAAQGIAGRGLEKNGDRSNAGFDDFGPRQQQNAAVPGVVGTGTSPGVFYDNGQDGDYMARVENLYNQTLGGRNGGLTNSGGLALQYAFLDDTEVEVVLRAVSKQERSEQIDAPRLLVYNNVRAHMMYLRQIAYIRDFEVEIAQAAAVANPVIGTAYDGVVLDVRPVVDSDLKFITMDIRPTVMTLSLPIPTFTTTLGVGQPISIQLPETTRQTVNTTLTMPDGGTVMLGGMRLVERQNQRSSVPLLGSLPGLSWLFSRNGTSIQNRKIIILVRAKIVLMEEMEPNPATLPSAQPVSLMR